MRFRGIVQDLEFRVQGSGFGVQGSGFGVQGSGGCGGSGGTFIMSTRSSPTSSQKCAVVTRRARI